jgi:hypothetical protein
VTQSATDRYGNVLTPVGTDVRLNVEIHDYTCDLVEAEDVDLNFACDPIVVSLHESRTVMIPKVYKTTPSTYQADLCGYFSHVYSTSFTEALTGVTLFETTSTGLPEFVTLD